MVKDNSSPIEKQWAVYPSGIGKVVREGPVGKIWIKTFESDSLEWAPKKVETFKKPQDAIEYFLSHQPFYLLIIKNKLQQYF